ncbi:uncharacterized protein LOC143151438 [Ptiloglossa arizonensis]|uniref:uncharacterized protein LOC143151438 n=1 Tax=Ptiloglossa arizonensis TaxID=3350558 RepID=UPI003F9F13BA
MAHFFLMEAVPVIPCTGAGLCFTWSLGIPLLWLRKCAVGDMCPYASVPAVCRAIGCWPGQVEAQFTIGRITKDDTKFGYVVAQLDGKYAEEVEDIICNPPDGNKYEAIKRELIKRLSDSDTTRVRKLLETEEIGDRTPTQFWRHLRKLAGSSVSDDFLTEIWKNRLPVKTQLVLAATSDKDGTKLAEIADRVHEIPVERGRIASVSHPSDMDLLREELRQMRLQLNAVTNSARQQWRSPRRERFRRRSSSRNPSQGASGKRELCWYHDRFAEKATKCIPPCKWAANGTRIATYGTTVISLNLSLRREFTWRFIVADVDAPIIGMDFLVHYNLLVDPRNKRLLDATTKLFIVGRRVTDKVASATCFPHENGETRHRAPYPEPRRLAPDRHQAAKAEFELMLRQGIIRPSKSPWATPLHLVNKKDGKSMRPCGDYRALNDRTVADRYSLPHIEDFAQKLAGKNVFSKVDLVRAYNQIPVAPQDCEKTAITTPFGLFEFVFMPFGLRNAAQTCQRFVDSVIRGLDFAYAYIDDFLIASENEVEHKEHLRLLFNRLNRYGIVINAAKCTFGVSEIEFLGYTVSRDGVKPLAERVEAIRNFAKPITVKLLRKFLGMVQRKVIYLCRGQAAEEAFVNIKEALENATTLAHPISGACINVTVDASDYTIGAVLQQLVDGVWQPLSFYTKALSAGQYIRHIKGIENTVADVLSRVESISSPPDYKTIEQSQEKDEELKRTLASNTGALHLKKVHFPGG